MDKDITKSALMEYLIPLDPEWMLQQINELALDKYVKKLDSVKTAKLFVFAQLMQIPSYTDISMTLNKNKDLQKEIDLPSISTSQLSRKWRDLNPAFMESILRRLVQKLFQRAGVKKANQKLGRIHIVDASTISLCLTKYRWAEFRKTKAGIKLHVRLIHDEEGSYPEELLITPAKTSDKSRLDALVTEATDVLNVFDRGYVDYRKFDQYCTQSIRFMTRLRHNSDIHVIEEEAADPASGILRRAIIRLGNEKTYLMEHPLRLIECLDQEGNRVMIVTNDFALSAEEMSELYRRRWQIELFFKWIKQHLHVKTCYGTSKNAVLNQIRAAIIVYCLTLLMQLGMAHTGRMFEVVKHLRLGWPGSLASFIKSLFGKPARSSKGRRRWDHERIYQETLRQVEAGTAAHWDELTYDPLM